MHGNLDTPQRHCMQEVTFIGNILYDPISMIFSRRQSYSDGGWAGGEGMMQRDRREIWEGIILYLDCGGIAIQGHTYTDTSF